MPLIREVVVMACNVLAVATKGRVFIIMMERLISLFQERPPVLSRNKKDVHKF